LTVRLVRFALWTGLAWGLAWWLPLPAPEMDLFDPAFVPDGDDPRSVHHRQTLLKYLLVRMALWVLFALFFGGFPDFPLDWEDPPDATEAAGWIGLVGLARPGGRPFHYVGSFGGLPSSAESAEFWGTDELVRTRRWGSLVLVVGVAVFIAVLRSGHAFGGFW
jgi:hypothetical protein